MIDLATGEEIGRNVSTEETAKMLLAMPGDTLRLRSFLRDKDGRHYLEGGEVASETLHVRVVETTRVTPGGRLVIHNEEG
jgi:hypothetical protein